MFFSQGVFFARCFFCNGFCVFFFCNGFFFASGFVFFLKGVLCFCASDFVFLCREFFAFFFCRRFGVFVSRSFFFKKKNVLSLSSFRVFVCFARDFFFLGGRFFSKVFLSYGVFSFQLLCFHFFFMGWFLFFKSVFFQRKEFYKDIC